MTATRTHRIREREPAAPLRQHLDGATLYGCACRFDRICLQHYSELSRWEQTRARAALGLRG